MSRIDDVKLSKTLSYLLRHGAVKEGLDIDSDGYINVNHILQHKNIKGAYSLRDITRVVETNDKQRFELKQSCEEVYIKANQGHSLQQVNSDSLVIISQASELPVALHGTYLKNWTSIKLQGLSRMSRNHIHLAGGLPADASVISGMRHNCELYIYIDVEKALSAGVAFYKSRNGVILTPGDKDGFLSTKYFSRVVEAKTGKAVTLD